MQRRPPLVHRLSRCGSASVPKLVHKNHEVFVRSNWHGLKNAKRPAAQLPSPDDRRRSGILPYRLPCTRAPPDPPVLRRAHGHAVPRAQQLDVGVRTLVSGYREPRAVRPKNRIAS
jgi:hypothetical protein